MKSIDKKNLVRQSAIKIIAREGYYNTKVEQIADDANIAKGTIYLYFNNKQEIFDYIFLVEAKKHIQYIVELEKGNYTALERLEAYIRYYFDQMENNIDIAKILMQEGIPNSKNSINIKNNFSQLTKMLAKVIDDGKKNGELKEIDTKPFVLLIYYLLQGGIFGFCINENMENYIERKEQLFAFIIDGIKK